MYKIDTTDREIFTMLIEKDSTDEFFGEVLQAILQSQRKAFLEEEFPSEKLRIDRLDRIIDMHIRYQDKIIEALNEDFNGRPLTQSMMSDVISTIMEAKETKKHVKRWMKPERRKALFPMNLLGGRAQVMFQPLGVVGNIVPWNFPVALAFSPAIGALAAGNRMMIKPSELVPKTSDLIKTMVTENFDQTELAIVTGGVEVGRAFSELPFDHLVFTGGPEIAKRVMSSAAKNLVPVTLELGGKCPVIVSESADMDRVVERVLAMKIFNAGQLCLTPDYVFLPDGRVEEFLEKAKSKLAQHYTSLLDNEDYTAIINERHWSRLKGYLDELERSGTRVDQFNPASEDFSSPARHKLPISFIVEPEDSVGIMQEEVFGPMLSLKSYKTFDETIGFINSKPRPLALYYFGNDEREIELACHKTTSGGVTINDVAQHAACHDLPLAGVGNSGMGSYHGRDGFLQFSHKKAIYRQGLLSLGKFMTPPFTDKKHNFIKKMVK